MDSGGEEKMSSMGAAKRLVKIEAQPEQIEVDLAKTAIIVVDMQNAFAGRGEDSSLPLQHIHGAKRAIKRTKRLVEASRTATIKVVYLTMIKNPERKGKSLIKSPRDTKIVDELTPQAGNVVVEKSCYSGFRGTKLDEVLKSYKIAYLIFTGIATNICVESTLRDAYFLDYWPILVSDATNNAGPSITQRVTLWNVGEAFGWVATTEDVLKALSGK
jgi:ureidoacrylate peracid hydrolase